MKHNCCMWKLNRYVRLIAPGVVANSVVTALPKDPLTRFTLSSSVFLAQDPNCLFSHLYLYPGWFWLLQECLQNLFLAIQRQTWTDNIQSEAWCSCSGMGTKRHHFTNLSPNKWPGSHDTSEYTYWMTAFSHEVQPSGKCLWILTQFRCTVSQNTSSSLKRFQELITVTAPASSTCKVFPIPFSQTHTLIRWLDTDYLQPTLQFPCPTFTSDPTYKTKPVPKCFPSKQEGYRTAPGGSLWSHCLCCFKHAI